MSNPRDGHPPRSPANANDLRDEDPRSGRISYDERGNSYWEWQVEPGVYGRDISTDRLKTLNLDELSLAETGRHERPSDLGPAPAKKPQPGGGFNPYDNTSTASGNVGGNPYNKDGMPAHKAESRTPAAPRKPMDLKKLEEWIAIRKRVQENQRDDED